MTDPPMLFSFRKISFIKYDWMYDASQPIKKNLTKLVGCARIIFSLISNLSSLTIDLK